jgi:hypothetical protein
MVSGLPVAYCQLRGTSCVKIELVVVLSSSREAEASAGESYTLKMFAAVIFYTPNPTRDLVGVGGWRFFSLCMKLIQ